MALGVIPHVYDVQSAVLRQITGLVHQICRLGWQHEEFHSNPVP